MPKFEIKGPEFWDAENEEFVTPVVAVVNLEHTLVSLSKWESKWEFPFYGDKEKTTEQTLDYILMMCTDEDTNPAIFESMSKDTVDEISKYIASKQTATWFSDEKPGKRNSEIITAELIYYWMVSLQIPFECQYWHVNKLLTLIKVCNAKNSPAKKMSKSEIAERNRRLNAERKAKLGTTG